MTPWTSRRWAALLAGGAAVVVLSIVVFRPDATPDREPPLAAEAPAAEPAAARHRGREDFPSRPEQHAPAQAEMPAPATPVAFAVPPSPPTEIPVGDGRPRPSPQSGAAWATEFRDAVCACSTRACVRDLQAAFIRKLESVGYDEARDGEKYTEATRAAIRCYSALPEDT
jgi:hypothetical protein